MYWSRTYLFETFKFADDWGKTSYRNDPQKYDLNFATLFNRDLYQRWNQAKTGTSFEYANVVAMVFGHYHFSFVGSKNQIFHLLPMTDKQNKMSQNIYFKYSQTVDQKSLKC